MPGEIRVVHHFGGREFHKSLVMFLKDEPQLGVPDEVMVYNLKSGEVLNIKKVDWNLGYPPTNKNDYEGLF